MVIIKAKKKKKKQKPPVFVVWECKESGTFVHCWWEWKMVHLLLKTIWQFLKQLDIELSYDPAIPF